MLLRPPVGRCNRRIVPLSLDLEVLLAKVLQRDLASLPSRFNSQVQPGADFVCWFSVHLPSLAWRTTNEKGHPPHSIQSARKYPTLTIHDPLIIIPKSKCELFFVFAEELVHIALAVEIVEPEAA